MRITHFETDGILGIGANEEIEGLGVSTNPVQED